MYVRRPHTDRIPEGVPKILRRKKRNRDSCKKNATGTENTGILRISVGICNLGLGQGFRRCQLQQEVKIMFVAGVQAESDDR